MKMSENILEPWNPGKKYIEKLKKEYACPSDVQISQLPRDANPNDGSGIPEGALVLSPNHLKHIRFPLHPLFHVVLGALDLHPMQLSPNSYLQISAFLAFGLRVGVSVDFADFFHFHDCVPNCKEEVEYFHFTSKTSCMFFDKKPNSEKNWRNRPLLVTGKWAAPEVKGLKIRSTFAASADNFKKRPIPKRIQWLRTCLAGRCLDIKKYSTPDLLLQISQQRKSIIYRLFDPTYLELKTGLEGKELATNIVKSLASMPAEFSESPEHVAERKRMRENVEKRTKSGETKAVNSFADPYRVDLDQAEPTIVRELPNVISLPSKPSNINKKRSESSLALGVKKRLKTQSAYSPWPSLEPISSPTSPLKSIPLNNENAASEPNLTTDFVSSNYWIPKFKKYDGTFVTKKEKLVGNREACLAVWQGLFHPADASAFQNVAPQEIMEAMNSRFIEFGQMVMAIETVLTQTREDDENKDKQLEELKLKFKKERQRVCELESQLRKVEAEREVDSNHFIKVRSELARTEKELKKEKDVRKLEFQKAEEKIVEHSVRFFKYGWHQALLPPDDRDVPGPDDLELSLDPRMKPSDGRVEDDSENEDEPEDEDDQDEEDDTDDEDDRDEEDFNDPGRPPENNQDVLNSLGRRDVDNNQAHQKSSMTHVETSPNRIYRPPQSNQETSNTTPQQKQTSPPCHPAQFNHPPENNQDVSNFVGRGGVYNNLGLSMHPQNMILPETSPNRIYRPPQSNQETSNTTPQQKQTSPPCHPAQFNHPPENNQDVSNFVGRGGVYNNLGLSMHPQNMILPETSPNSTYIPPQSNQETSNTTPQQKQISPPCHPAQFNHPPENNQDVSNFVGRGGVYNNLGLSMHPQNMILPETSPNRIYRPPQSNQETSNTTPQQKQTSPPCHLAQFNHPPENNQDVSNFVGRGGVYNNLGLSVHPQNMILPETSPNSTYIPPQSNQETSNTTPQQKQISPPCHPAQFNHPPENNQDVSNFVGRGEVRNNLGWSMHTQNMILPETSPNRTYIPPQSNQETSNTTPQQKQTCSLCHPAHFNHPPENNQDVSNSLGSSVYPQYMIQPEPSSNRTYLPPHSNQETSNTPSQLTSPSQYFHVFNTDDIVDYRTELGLS